MLSKSNSSEKSFFRLTLFIALFAAFIIVGSYIYIPLPWSAIPFSLQTLFINLAALFLGPAYASFSVLLYIIIGTLGLPVFAGGGGGITYILGPTGGFLIGFIPTAIVIGLLKGPPSAFWRNYIACCIATVLLYAIGAVWFQLVTDLAWNKVILAAVLPFLIGDSLKILVSCILYRSVPILVT